MSTYITAVSCFTVITDPFIAEKMYIKYLYVGLFILSKLEGVFSQGNVGLYRDDESASHPKSGPGPKNMTILVMNT